MCTFIPTRFDRAAELFARNPFGRLAAIHALFAQEKLQTASTSKTAPVAKEAMHSSAHTSAKCQRVGITHSLRSLPSEAPAVLQLSASALQIRVIGVVSSPRTTATTRIHSIQIK